METSFTVIIVNNVKNAITTTNNRLRWELVKISCIRVFAQFPFYKNVFMDTGIYVFFLSLTMPAHCAGASVVVSDDSVEASVVVSVVVSVVSVVASP